MGLKGSRHQETAKGNAQNVSHAKEDVIDRGGETAVLLGHHGDHRLGVGRIKNSICDRSQGDHRSG